MLKWIIGIWIIALLACSSCNRNSQNATVTVDTVETDFFEGLTPSGPQFTFEGVLPCADCAGINTQLILYDDSMSYFLTETYMGKSSPDSVYTRSGIFTRLTAADSISTILELSPAKEIPKNYFLVLGDSALKKLDNNGKVIVSESNYLLMRK